MLSSHSHLRQTKLKISTKRCKSRYTHIVYGQENTKTNLNALCTYMCMYLYLTAGGGAAVVSLVPLLYSIRIAV